ncbi:MAG: SusC/RagA family TonB-linked outer membrane protein [Ginsengibacter sp.]
MRKFICLLFFNAVVIATMAQKVAISGKVTDSVGNPVYNASIREPKSRNGTVSDLNGNFTINTNPGTALEVSIVGYKPVLVNAAPNLNVTLLSNNTALTEVVVTALGIRRTDKSTGYSIAKVDPGVLTQKSEPDLLKGMQGKVAGVDIRSSQGTPGAATRIQIRGNSSFFGNNEPLIVVDGIPFSNDQVTTSQQTSGGGAYGSGIANLDPNDIASMNVLKGSSAAAIYGSRASNGVIIITTKSGSATKSKKGLEVTFKTSYSIEQIANLPNYQNEYGAGTNFLYQNSNGSWGPAFRNKDSIPVWGNYKNAYPELFPTDSVAYRAYPNNVNSLFDYGKVFENSVGFTGGDEKSAVSLTLSNLNHQGYVPGTKYDRSNIGLGGSTKLTSGINIRGNFSYAKSRQLGGFFGYNQVDGAASQFARSFLLARNWNLDLPFEDENQNPLIPNAAGSYDNPKWSAKYNRMLTDEERFIAGAHMDFKINNWIRVDYSIGSNINQLERREITEIGSRAANSTGRLVVENYRKQEIESNLILTFTPKVSQNITVRATLGNNYNQRTIKDLVTTGNQFITRGIYTLRNTSQQIFNTDYYERRRIVGVFADATLGFKNYFFLNLTGRNDWSSTLPINNRSYFYPAVSGSLIFTDALKIQSNILDYGKVRAGWAKVGRDADPYSLQNVYRLGTSYLGQPTAALDATAFDPDLKPEFTKEFEYGAQLSFFKRKIEVDVAIYDRNSTNQIAPISTPASSGYSSYYTNYGELSNKGVEIDLILRPLQSKSFKWEIHGTFTRNKNIVEKLIEGVDRLPLFGVLEGISPYLEPGRPFGYLRGTVDARDPATGALLINPTTGFMIQALEEQFIGNPNPDYKMGITNTFSFKGLIMSALFDMTKGGALYSSTIADILGRGVTKDNVDRETSWIIPGIYGDPNTGLPLLVGGKTVTNQTRLNTNDLYFGESFATNSASEWNVYDATVYRLREVTLGYDVPKRVFNRLPIGGITVTLTGRNLWYLAPNFPKHINYDPEVNSFGSTSTQGIELNTAPTTRRFGINLNVTF